VLDFERNVYLQVQSDDVHDAIRLSTLLVIFGGYAIVEISKNVMDIVIFEIVKHYRAPYLKVTAVAQNTDEFSRAMVVMPDFVIIFRKRFATVGTRSIVSFLSSAAKGNISWQSFKMAAILPCSLARWL
jgi:hypothetical protein